MSVEPRTPPRSAVAVAAAAGSTATPGSPRSGPSATKSPLVHGRTAAGPSSARRGADTAAVSGDGHEDGTETPGFGQGLIAAAACFLLRQAPPEGASAAAAASAGPLVAAAGQVPIDPVGAMVPAVSCATLLQQRFVLVQQDCTTRLHAVSWHKHVATSHQVAVMLSLLALSGYKLNVCCATLIFLLLLQPPVPKRPIRMIAQDVKLLCPAELRDTCMLLFHHMQKAFSGITFGGPKGPVRISTKQQQQQQAGEGGSGSSSPKINRSQSDGMQGSASLQRSSLGAVEGLRRHGSSDAVSTTDPAGGAAGNGSSSGASNNVNTPAEEERMLQTILAQNAAAAAAAAAAERKRAAARAREMQARSGSTGGVSAGGASIAPTDSFVSSVDSGLNVGAGQLGAGPEGLGHATSAVRALRGAGGSGGSALGRVAAGHDDEHLHDSPLSGTMSDVSHLSATDSSATPSAAGPSGAAAEAQAAQGGSSLGGGLGVVEQMLLEYEIEFVQVQVSPSVPIAHRRSQQKPTHCKCRTPSSCSCRVSGLACTDLRLQCHCDKGGGIVFSAGEPGV